MTSDVMTGSDEEIAERLQAFEEAGVDPMGVVGLERFGRVVELLRG